MKRRAGRVWWNRRLVGHLREDDRGLLHFAYDRDWLGAGFPISVGLPLAMGEQERNAHSFFSGLLPEGGMRQQICRRQGIAEQDDTGLLLAIGGDCAGALSILPADAQPEAEGNPAQRLDPATLAALIRRRGTELPGGTLSPPRFSLAGAQDKLPIGCDADGYWLPDTTHPSSHIIKFETIKRVCFAELMANRIAAALGLPVVETAYRVQQEGAHAYPWLLVRRYDRLEVDGRLLRLHQEDMMQALGEPVGLKYQSDGGPSMAAIAEFVRQHLDRPAQALGLLRDWQIVNFLIGNWDGHGKNLALLYRPGAATPLLAPFYDLVAIEFLNQITPGSYAREMALYIGDERTPERIGGRHWSAFAQQLGIPPKPLLRRVEDLAAALPEVARNCRAEFAAAHGDQAVHHQLDRSIDKRCRATLNALARGR